MDEHAVSRWCCATWVSVLLAACSSSAHDLSSRDVGNPAGPRGMDAAVSRGMDAAAASPPGLVSDAGQRPPMLADPADPAAYIYDQSALRSYELRLSPEDLARIDADPASEVYVPGTLVFEGKEYGPVGIRYKGSVGAFRGCLSPFGAKSCTKLSMKVSFNWQLPAVEFYGLRKLQFHSMNRDPSMLKDRLGYTMFREFGQAAPRAVHARLTINGVFIGLFALVEQIDGRFTRSRFADGGQGNLYQEAWPVTASKLAVNEAYLRQRLETNADQNPSFAPMLDFSAALAAAAVSDLPDTIAKYTDVSAIMRYVAVDRTIAHDDGPFHFYCGGSTCTNHNFFWYQESIAPRLWLIAWDLDSSFNLNNTTTTLAFPWDDASVQCVARVFPPATLPLLPPLCDKLILGWAGMQQQYVDAIDAFLAGPFRAESVNGLLTEWQAQIRPVVEEAANAHADAVTPAAWDAATAALRSAIVELRQRAVVRVAEGRKLVVDPWIPSDAGSIQDPLGSGLDGGN